MVSDRVYPMVGQLPQAELAFMKLIAKRLTETRSAPRAERVKPRCSVPSHPCQHVRNDGRCLTSESSSIATYRMTSLPCFVEHMLFGIMSRALAMATDACSHASTVACRPSDIHGAECTQIFFCSSELSTAFASNREVHVFLSACAVICLL